MDTLTTQQRSERMSRVRGKNTGPELVVRKLLYAMGYRYRLHAKGLPGRPDVFFPGRKAAIFVHGCFWHRHDLCRLARMPKSRLAFWGPKLDGNKARDARNVEALETAGWRVLVVWECELQDQRLLRDKLAKFMEKNDAGG